MSRATAAATVVVISLAATAIWLVGRDRGPAADGAVADAAPEMAYDMEAHDVVLRQMDADGRQEFQIEAPHITQAAGDGEISATALTLIHDPPGAPPGEASRWTLTADAASLPAEGGVITLQGKVRASGWLRSGSSPISLATESLRYDMDAQQLSSDVQVRVTTTGIDARTQGARFDIKTSKLTLDSSLDGTLTP